MARCSQCPSLEATRTLHGQRICDECALRTATAATTDVNGSPRLVHELPSPTKARRSGRQREGRRAVAERAAVARLKLLHLPEYQAIYADELHRAGLKPSESMPFDVHIRKLAGQRLAAIVSRSQSA